MSGSILDARIPMAGGYGPDIGAAVAQGLKNASDLTQLQQVQQQIKRQNQLRGILGAPGAVDPTTGTVKPETIGKVMSVDPATGIKLGENAVLTQQRQLQMQGLRSKASAEQAQLLNDKFSPIVLQHEEAIKSGKVTQQQADIDSQKAWTEARDELVKSGAVTPEVAQNIPTQWNYQDAKRRALASDVYLQNIKRQDEEARQKRLEKHDEMIEERTGTTTGTLADGTPVIFKPNAPTGQRVTYAQSGKPVPEELLQGAHKLGPAGAGNLDRDAVANVVRSDYEKELGRPINLTDPNEKAELDRRVLAAEDRRKAEQAGTVTTARETAKQAIARPVPVTVNGVRQDAVWHDNKYWNPDGTPIEGTVLGVTRTAGQKTPGQAAEEDAMAIADKRIATKEAELGRPLDQAERAEQRQIARADPKIQESARKNDANAIPDDAAKLIAEETLKGDWHATVGMGRNQASMRKIAEWRAKIAKEQGITGSDLAANTAEFNGIMAAERVLGTRGAGIDLGIAEAQKFAPMVLRASDMVDRTRFPTVNSLQLAAEKGTGGEAVIRLIDSLNAYKMAYTQILTRGGMPTDDARRRSDEIIDKAWSNGQIKTALDQLNQEMNGARSAVPEVRDNLYRALTGKSRATSVEQVPSPVSGPQRTGPVAPAQGAISPELQQGIEILRKRPETAATFERHFNLPPGSAQQYLQAPSAAAPTQQNAGGGKPNLETMQSAVNPQNGKKIYWDGKAWINPDGTPYKP